MASHDENIGQILTLKRGDMSQQALAEAMRARGWKWSQATVWSVEKGERPLRMAEGADLAAILGMDVKEFLATPEGEAILEEVRAAVANVHAAEKKIWDAANEYEGALGSAEWVASKVETRASELPAGTVEAGRLRYWMEKLQNSQGKLPDAVIREYMEVRYGEHPEEV